jgi:hypothetical protein
MNDSFWAAFNRYLYRARRWYEQTPVRALDQAYDAALIIKAIEDEHFDGQAISPATAAYSENTFAYFQAELKKYLKIAELRLAEFKSSRSFFNTTDASASVRGSANAGNFHLQNSDQAAVILEKLKFVDQVIDRYHPRVAESLSLVPIPPPSSSPVNGLNQATPSSESSALRSQADTLSSPPPSTRLEKSDGLLDKTGVLPRTILGTVNRIKRDLDPDSERQVVQSFRNTKAKTVIAIRFLLMLIIIPLLTQQISKTFLVGPIVDRLRPAIDQSDIFINFELEEAALKEMVAFRERLEFDKILGRTPAIGEEKREPAPLPREPTAPAESPSEPKKSDGKSETSGKATERSESPSALKHNEEKSVLKQPSNPPEGRPLTNEERIVEKAREIAQTYYKQGSSAIKNIFADLISLGAFACVIAFNSRAIAVLKSFIDETVYGLSDSAKAFIIILFTDTFVGFHSPHGWEVLIESVSKHFGIPANQAFASMFIATFPVLLDTIFKYWIFRYLNQVSPSAVATYRNMNE